MADAENTATEEADAAAEVVDEARSRAAETRTVAKWVASALAGIPTLTLVTTLVAPGDAGFDPRLLFAGIALGGVAALIGIFTTANVLGPLALSDADVRNFDIKRIPGHDIPDSAQLLKDIETLSDSVGEAQRHALYTEVDSDRSRQMASALDNDAKDFEDRAAKDPTLKDEATRRRAQADKALVRSAELSARAKLATVSLKASREQIAARKRIRAEAIAVIAGERVAEKFVNTQGYLTIAAILAGLGVFSLAMAPNIEPPENAAADPPALVNLQLEQPGRDLLGCGDDVDEVQAIQVGGTEDQPVVITLPFDDCPAVYMDFKDAEDQPLGNVTRPELLTPAPEPADDS